MVHRSVQTTGVFEMRNSEKIPADIRNQITHRLTPPCQTAGVNLNDLSPSASMMPAFAQVDLEPT
jgi:hypothetical protein